MIRAAVALIAVVTLGAAVGTQSPAPAAGNVALRFHHVHYRVDDPGHALGDAAERLTGTRAIVQGVGVGIKVGREYVLFDRSNDGPVQKMSVRPSRVADAYLEAIRWLTARGLAVSPASLADTAVSATLPFASFDHLAFAAVDLRAAVDALAATPLSLTDDAARFRLPSGRTIEIVRDTDRPDTHWCPMHPDVRSPGDARCRICGMALVPIPPPRVGEYRLDVAVTPREGGGIAGLRLTVRDPETNEPVPRFIDLHERPFHLFLISRDLTTFAHVHPELRDDGSFELRHELAPGEYMVIADFLPAGGTPQLVQRAIMTPGYTGRLFAAPADVPLLPPDHVAGGLRIHMEAAPAAARRETLVRFDVSDAATGRPTLDLEPYLGASGHLLVVNQDLTSAIHGHPEGADTRGPSVTFGPVFPAPGRYKMWVQFQRKGEIVTAPFVIDVP